MKREDNDFWDALGDHLDPIQVPMLEALWRIGEPLSAICMVDVLDGYLSMWEAPQITWKPCKNLTSWNPHRATSRAVTSTRPIG